MDTLTSGTPHRQRNKNMAGKPIESRMRHVDASAAYTEGYADGSILLHATGQAHDLNEPLAKIHTRYLHYIQAEQPTPVERAYVIGFRDAAADNLPCPPHEIEPHLHLYAA